MSRNLLKEIIKADDEFIANTLNDMTPEKFKKFCEDAMKQQDRDTRHACAEAVSALGSEVIYPHRRMIESSDAVREVTNCRGGLKS